MYAVTAELAVSADVLSSSVVMVYIKQKHSADCCIAQRFGAQHGLLYSSMVGVHHASLREAQRGLLARWFWHVSNKRTT